MGLVERIKSVTLALTERKRSTVAEEMPAPHESDSEDSEVCCTPASPQNGEECQQAQPLSPLTSGVAECQDLEHAGQSC